MIIAIDGPAAAGKGTIAKRLAIDFNLAYLDTGALYRAAALRLQRAGFSSVDPIVDSIAATKAAEGVKAACLQDPDLRTEAVGIMASKVAQIAGVRQALLDYQRYFANHPPAGFDGTILDGRDIGTVICPQAAVKIFITASPIARAQRRFLELAAKEATVDFDSVYQDVLARDARDSARQSSPLKPAEDAHLLDTTDLDIEAAFRKASDFVKAGLASQ